MWQTDMNRCTGECDKQNYEAFLKVYKTDLKICVMKRELVRERERERESSLSEFKTKYRWFVDDI